MPASRVLCCFALFCVSFAGCKGDGRPSLVAVEGVLTVDGEPANGATVVFQPVDVAGDYNRPSRGKTDASGKFQVGTYGADDGLPIGTYNVGCELKELVGEVPEGYDFEDVSNNKKPIVYKLIIPKKYANPEESGISVEVTKDGLEPGTFNIDTEGASPETERIGGPSGAAA